MDGSDILRESPSPPRVVFFTDNGHGLGHLTRLMAVAQKAEGRFEPFFLTMSTGYPLLREAGLASEFFPSYSQLGLTKKEWTPLLTMRLCEVLQHTRARALVVDHVMPPATFQVLRPKISGLRLIWSRRGLWREGRNEEGLAMSSGFDLVVEPGDVAGPIDLGATATEHDGVVRTSPIVLVQPHQYMPRIEARSALGLPAEGRAILVQLSDSDPKKLATLIRQVRHTVLSVAEGEAIHFFAPLHALHGDSLTRVEGVTMAPVYPVARYFSAFDGVVSTAGYNSFHEIVVSGLPAIFVARDSGSLDDQERRAEFGELSGRSFWASSVNDERFEKCVENMLRPDEPEIAGATASALGGMQGAAEFSDLLARAVGEELASEPAVPPASLDAKQKQVVALKLRSGRKFPEADGAVPLVVLVVATEHDTPQLDALAEEFANLEERFPRLSPVFLIGRGSPGTLTRHRFPFESVLEQEEWSRLGDGSVYANHIEERIGQLRERYAAGEVVRPQPGESLGELSSLGAEERVPGAGGSRLAHSFTLELPSVQPPLSRSIDIRLTSPFYVPSLLERGGLADYEPATLSCWLSILSLPRSGAAFDIGANVGPFSWLAAAFTNREVVAFEPVPELLDALASVAKANGLDIRREAIALAERDGTASFHLSDQTDSSHSLVPGFRRSSRSIDVVVRTLDSYVEETGLVPHVLKIDTETSEPEVLTGANETLRTYRPWLIVEVLAGRTEDRLMQVLQPLDYWWYPISERIPFQATTEIIGDPTYEHTNWLFAPEPLPSKFWDSVSSWQAALSECIPPVASTG